MATIKDYVTAARISHHAYLSVKNLVSSLGEKTVPHTAARMARNIEVRDRCLQIARDLKRADSTPVKSLFEGTK